MRRLTPSVLNGLRSSRATWQTLRAEAPLTSLHQGTASNEPSSKRHSSGSGLGARSNASADGHHRFRGEALRVQRLQLLDLGLGQRGELVLLRALREPARALREKDSQLLDLPIGHLDDLLHGRREGVKGLEEA